MVLCSLFIRFADIYVYIPQEIIAKPKLFFAHNLMRVPQYPKSHSNVESPEHSYTMLDSKYPLRVPQYPKSHSNVESPEHSYTMLDSKYPLVIKVIAIYILPCSCIYRIMYVHMRKEVVYLLVHRCNGGNCDYVRASIVVFKFRKIHVLKFYNKEHYTICYSYYAICYTYFAINYIPRQFIH